MPAEREAPILEGALVHTEEAPGQEETPTSAIVAVGSPARVLPAGDAPFSPSALLKKRLVEATIRDFQGLLRDSVQMVLDGGCSFGELEPMLRMYLGNLVALTSEEAASPFQRRLAVVEKDVQELLALRSKDLLALASERAKCALEERQQSLDQLMAEESELAKGVEKLAAEGKEMEEEHRKAEAYLADMAQSIATAKRTIAELQNYLATKEPLRERALKELGELEAQQQLLIADFEGKNKALEETRRKLQSAVSSTDEDIRQEILAILERDHQRAIQEAESRLKGF